MKHGGDQVKKSEMHRACGIYEGEVHVGFWGGNLKERDHFEDPGINGWVLFSKNSMGRGMTGLIWLRIGRGGGFL
jgi:hypothetical protein